MKNHFLIINGPNLDMLGKRENTIYGEESLEEIKKWTNDKIKKLAASADWIQSNSEESIINALHDAQIKDFKAIIINPAAFSHSSIAILDAIKMLDTKVIEVHLTNVHQREQFRHNMITAIGANSLLQGFGKKGYYLAMVSELMDE